MCWIMHRKPNLAHVVSVTSMFMVDIGQAHWKTLK